MSFIEIAQSLLPYYLRVPLLGHLLALDQYNRDTRVDANFGTAEWRWSQGFGKASRGYGYRPNGDPFFTPDAPELDATAFTLFLSAVGLEQSPTTDSYLIAKRSSGTVDWIWRFLTGPDRIVVVSNVTSSLAATVTGCQDLAVTIQNGARPLFYCDGSFIGEGDQAVAIAAGVQDLYVGGRYTGINALDADIQGVAMFPVLTDLQIAQLHRAFTRLRLGRGPLRFRRLPGEDLNNASLHIAGDRLAGGNFPELINGYNGVPQGQFTVPEGPTGERVPGFGGQGAGAVVHPPAAVFPTEVLTTWMFPVHVRSTGEAGAGRLIEANGGGAANDLQVRLSGAINGDYLVNFTDGKAQWQWAMPAGAPYDCIVTIRHDRTNGTNLPRVWVDREEVTVNVITGRSGNLSINAAYDLMIGNTGVLNRTADSDIGPVKFWNRLLTDAEREQELVQLSNRPQYLTRRFRQPVSLAAVAANAQAGPWEILAGTFEWTDDGERRKLECVTAGDALATLGTKAYGAWYFRMKKALDGSTTIFGFICSSREDINGGTQDGYSLSFSSTERVVGQRRDNGAPTSLPGLVTDVNFIALGVEYEVFIRRRSTDSTIQVWVRGGIYVSWTSIGTRADSTYVDSDFITFNADPGDTIGDVMFFELGAALEPTDVFPD